MTAREYWRVVYRMIRIARRETLKAAMDTMIYGTGAVYIPANGDDPRHVPWPEMADIIQRDK